MNTRSKSTLFLIEQLIVVAVFAICAAACITMLTFAYFTTVEKNEMRNAILVAENAAEVFKATDGSAEGIVSILGGEYAVVATAEGSSVITTIYYDSDWQVSTLENASFKMQLSRHVTPSESMFSLVLSDLVVTRINGEEILSFPVAVISSRTGGASDE